MFLCVFAVICSVVFGFDGTVIDEHSGKPIAAANIVVIGTHIGATTNIDGEFTLDVELPTEISVSFVGYKTKVVHVTETGIEIEIYPTAIEGSEIVVTSTRGAAESSKSPQPTSSINSRQMSIRNTLTLDDAMRGMAGLSMNTTGSGSVRPTIRGLYDSHVLTLMDGIPLMDLRPGGDHVLLLEPSQLGRIEIVRGPGSVLYGSDAIGGIVNFISKEFESMEGGNAISGDFRAGYSSLGDGYNVDLSIEKPFNKTNIGAGFGYRSNDDISDAAGEIPNSDYSGYHADLSANGSFGANKLSFGAHYISADVGVPISPSIESAQFEGESQLLTLLKYQGVNISVFKTLQANVSWQKHHRHFHKTWPTGDPNMDAQVWVDIDGLTFQLLPMLERGGFVLQPGIDITYQYASSDRVVQNTGSGDTTLDSPVIPNSDRLLGGVFLQASKPLGAFDLSAGGRYDIVASHADARAPEDPFQSDEYNSTDADFSGNLSLRYEREEGFFATAAVGRAFRSPTLLERYFRGPHQTGVDQGNPDLESETSLNFDLGLGWSSDLLNTRLSGFRNQVDNYIYKENSGDTTSDGAEIWEWKNEGSVELIGFEAEIRVSPCRWFGAIGNLSYVEGKDENGNYMPDIPPLNGNLDLRFEKWGFATDLFWLFASKQDKIADSEATTDGWLTHNVSLSYDLSNIVPVDADLILTGKNLTNEVYYNHLSRIKDYWAEPGRSFTISLDLHF